MRWITRERIKVDRVACPWLIRKFIDPNAQFVFLPPDTEWASVTDGTVFDVPGCELGSSRRRSVIRFLSEEVRTCRSCTRTAGTHRPHRRLEAF